MIYSFKEAFGRIPSSEDDWNDVARIATNKVPIQRSKIAEQKAKDIGAIDGKSIMTIAYGLRPVVRDIEKEKQGLKDFVKKYKRIPKNTFDWNILRSIVY